MASIATNIWEFRATAGDANAGGGFDTASGGTDYSNQNSAQLQLTDLATSGIGVTTLTSATGGFTAAMVGNYIQIRSGTNLVTGFYRVTAYTDTNTVTIDRAADDGVGGVSGGSGDLGGALDILTDAFIEDVNAVIAGNTIYIKNDGTATMSTVSTARDGTAELPITIDGYNTTRGENPTGTDRPLLAFGASTLLLGDYFFCKNIRMTGTATAVASMNISSVFINCKITNSSVSSNRIAFNLNNTFTAAISCEGISTLGIAFELNNRQATAINCYAHDSATGIHLDNNDHDVLGCIIDTCTTGMLGDDSVGITISGNVIYNCTTGLTDGVGKSYNVYNNIFYSNTTAISWGTEQKINIFNYNLYDDNGTDVVNVTKGDNAVSGDPLFTNAAGGDFTLGTGSAALDVGFDVNGVGGVVV